MSKQRVRLLVLFVLFLALWPCLGHTVRADAPVPELRLTVDLDEQVDVIVRLKSSSAADYKFRLTERLPSPSMTLDQQVRDYENVERRQQDQLLAELVEKGIPFRIRRRYTYLLNGMAATIQRSDLAHIAALPGVLSVEPDPRLQVLLDESVPLIGATEVWSLLDSSSLPVTGVGVKLAIIDSGIDYTHPDLGGCFGAGCKVAGGYDLVNEDADPLDDHGHGTHCAGIAAANGAVKGVAPGATLYAYKAMNEYGWGSGSMLIAALERATNPDGDPATDDGADVINMSVGQVGGTPTDAISAAVDAAVSQGAVVVVAVGNEGDSGYWTVGSPGTSQKAISVGASTKSDELFSLSSRGPITDWWTLIKPDILAPGASISSTVPATGFLSSPSRYLRLSGDSMAVPHIAGCAALIQQLHPEWTPEQIKANLMNTARDLGLGAYVQGAGRVQVDQAALAPVLIMPASIGFGFVDSQVPFWTASAPLNLTNLTTGTVHYALTVTGTLPAGVNLRFEPTVIDLGPGQTLGISVAITIDNAILPLSTSDPYFSDGHIAAVPRDGTAGPSLGVPLSFCKTSYLEISHWGAFRLLVHDGTHQWLQDEQNPSSPVIVLLPVGTYDVIAASYLARAWVVREGVIVTGTTRLVLHRDEATHHVTMNPLDAAGDSVSSTRWGVTQRVTHLASGVGMDLALISTSLFSVALSHLTEHYAWECRVDTEREDNWFEFNYRLVGVHSDSVMSNKPSELRRVEYAFHAVPGTTGLLARVWAPFASIVDPVSAALTRQAYYMPFHPDSRLPRFVVSTHDPATDDWVHISPELVITPGGEILGWIPQNNEPIFKNEGLEVHLGQSPPHWFSAFANRSTRIGVKPAIKNGSWFLYQSSDRLISGPHPYQVYQAGTLIALDSLYYTGGPWQDMPVQYTTLPAPGAYSFTVSSDPYWVGGHSGLGQVLAEFDTRLTDKDPPTLLALNILRGGETTDTIPRFATCLVRFRMVDAVAIGSVELFYRVEGDWTAVALTRSGDEYSGRFPGRPNDALVSLRIVAQDAAGNRLTYEAVPAFQVLGEGAVEPTPTPTATASPSPTPPPSGRQVILQQGKDGYSGAQDTTLDQWAPDTNACSSEFIKVGYHQQYASIVRFDVTSIPNDARIGQAKMELHARAWDGTQVGVGAFYITRTVNLCRATWNRASTAVAWDSPGCNNTVTDRRPAPEDSFITSGNYQWYNLDLTQTVQGWVDGSLANNGVLIRASAYAHLGPFQFASAENGEASQRPRLVVYYTRPQVQVTDDPAIDHDPAVVQTDDGTLWVVWSSNRSGNSDLWCRSSPDGGKSWSTESRLTNDPGSDESPGAIMTSAGKLLLVWQSDRSGQAAFWFKTSEDAGHTWSSETYLGPVSSYARPSITQASDGKLWVLWLGGYYRTSSDGGVTWSAEGRLSGGNGRPTIYQAHDGVLWVVYPAPAAGHNIGDTLWGMTSHDAGATWSAARELTPGGWKTYDDLQAMAQDKDGRLYLFWMRDQAYDSCGPNMLYQSSDDNGLTWSEPEDWLPLPGGESAPRLVALNEGNVAVVWSSRQVGDDIWLGVPGQTDSSRLPPYVCCAYQEMPSPYYEVPPGEVVRLCAQVYGAEQVALAWSRNGAPQPALPFGPGGYPVCSGGCGGNYSVELGPFSAGDVISYQLQIEGTTWPTVLWPSQPRSFAVSEPATATPTQSVTCTRTATATATATPTRTAIASPTPSATRTPTSMATETNTPIASPSPTATEPLPTPSPSATTVTLRAYLPLLWR